MPTYDYRCEACKKTFEIFHSIRETKRKCPGCGQPRLVREIGPGSGFLFKGSGFYITDYRNKDYQSKAKAESEAPKSSGSGSDSGSKKDSGKKDSGKKDSGKKDSPKAASQAGS